MAFVTESGLDEITWLLQGATFSGMVRIVTGLYQNVTEPKALKILLQLQKTRPERCEIRLSKDRKFHRKLVLLENGTRATAIIGSSNLTREGLSSSGELNLMISLARNISVYKRLKKAFEKDWSNYHSVPLTYERIKIYEKVHRKSLKQQSLTQSQLELILGAKPKHEIVRTQKETIGIWLDGCKGSVEKDTVETINDTTDWEKKKYEWYSTAGIHRMKQGDEIYMFDFTDKIFSRVKVIAETRTPNLTSNGRYFVAYKPVKNYRRNITDTLWNQLKYVDISKRTSQKRKKVREKIAKQLMKILRKRR
jgi:HKD family nuclease